MFGNITSIVLCVGGLVASLFAEKFGLERNPMFYVKALTAIFGGGGYAIYNNLSLITESLKVKPLVPPTVVVPTAPTAIEKETKIYLPEDYEIKDFEAITHLRDRCVAASSDEGLEACTKLQAILFQLDIPKKV